MLVYGIDFGTSNSILGAADQQGPRGFAPLDPAAPDPAILRSLLYFPNAKEVFYGARAVQEFVSRDHTGRFIRSIKKQLPSRSFVGTFVDQRPFNLEDLIGVFLGEVRRRANEHFQQDVTRVVLGRPAKFAPDEADDRYAEGRLERAARIAGFKEIEFLPEPVAAAMGYDSPEQEPASREEIVLAADYGGGTSDFTLYRFSTARRFRTSDVIGLGGVALAGDALDASLMRQRISPHFGTGVQYQVPFGSNVLTMPKNLMERICHPAEISLLREQDTREFLRNVQQWSLSDEDQEKMERLFILLDDQLGFPIFEAIEGTKKELSRSEAALFEYTYPGISIRESVLRGQFEEYASSSLSRIDQALQDTLDSAGVTPGQVDRVLCTGGTARVSWIRKSLMDRFGREKLFDLDPFRGVARGLMQRASELAGQ